MHNILIVDKDANFANALRIKLEGEGYGVFTCDNTNSALKLLKLHFISICILEAQLWPEDYGIDLARKIRLTDVHVPIFVMSAQASPEDRIQSFLAGADAFITKPFSMQELLLRIAVWIKRSSLLESSQLCEYVFESGIVFRYNDRTIGLPGKEVSMTYLVGELLKFLLENPNTPLKKEAVADLIWQQYDYYISRSMDVIVTRIRGYFKNEQAVRLETIRSVGYNFRIFRMEKYINGTLVRRIGNPLDRPPKS